MINYYRILGLTPKASKPQIKKAYRKLAMKYHPDKNKDPNATAKFVKIIEAYEILTSANYDYNSILENQKKQDEFRQAQQEAQARADRYARMKRNEFRNTEAYKIDKAEAYIVDYIDLYYAYFVVFIMPPLCFIVWGVTGLYWCGGFLFLSWATWIDIFTTNEKLNFRRLLESLQLVSKTIGFRSGALIIFSIYSLFAYFPNTVLPHLPFLYIILLLILGFFISYIYLIIVNKKFGTKIYIFILPIASFCFFLFVNYQISFNRVVEEYKFSRTTQIVTSNYKARVQSTTLIYFEKNNYDSAFGIRSFPIVEKLDGCNWVIYEFETGLFGLKVLKDYRFELRK